MASSSPSSRVANKVCIVTGASSGIGRAIALRFAREGAAYVLCADLQGKILAATHELIAQQHGAGKAKFSKVDVTVEQEVKNMVQGV
ncbi:hypothetical protein NEMBOFW57_005308 [Staphylotrichum longicolle]|uniref:Uncharacterized protein n=1 Tax=Staphylotrichum longicolle TaxID=669026 RepID=A0AAD4I1D3_9PEZI|nr:hypothetical protein NEMBOFW57_005308 [Staphylotrichum longicolle]